MSLKNWTLERRQWPWARRGVLESLAEVRSVGWLLDVGTGRDCWVVWCSLPGGEAGDDGQQGHVWEGRCLNEVGIGSRQVWVSGSACRPWRCSAGMQAGVTVRAAVWGQDVAWHREGQLSEQKRAQTGGQGRWHPLATGEAGVSGMGVLTLEPGWCSNTLNINT